MTKSSKIYLPGHTGMVGSAILRLLRERGYENLILKSSKELDLRKQDAVKAFFEDQKPEFVFLAAAKVGGILANSSFPAEFIYDNLMIQTNVIHCAYEFGVKRLLFLGSSCIYPRLAPQPMKEDYLLSGKLEPTNEAYAIAKIAGIEMCQSYNKQYGTHFVPAMPSNLYGPGDNFNLETSHFLPAWIRKFHEAKISRDEIVTLWGTGLPRRELTYVDDLADASLFLMENDVGESLINIGSGKDSTLREMSEIVSRVVGFSGKIVWDETKPDGMPQKLLDSSKMTFLGWHPKVNLEEGIEITYQWYQKNLAKK